MPLHETFTADSTNDIVVALPFVAAARAASAPALGRFGRLYGSSSVMQEVYRMIEKVAPTEATVNPAAGRSSSPARYTSAVRARTARLSRSTAARFRRI